MRNKVIVAPVEYEARVITNEGKGMAVEVLKHGVARPSADYANVIRVNTAQQQGHCATRTERTSCDIGRIDTSMTWNS